MLLPRMGKDLEAAWVLEPGLAAQLSAVHARTSFIEYVPG